MTRFLASKYWEKRYASGNNSGSGSRGVLAFQKAEYINSVLARPDIQSVVDWGCGDGVLLSRLNLGGLDYVGVDPSLSALRLCSDRRPDLPFVLWRENDMLRLEADLSMSIDVLFHFPDDDEYDAYLGNLFTSSRRYVLTHNTEQGPPPGEHVKWRSTSVDIQERYPEWDLIETSPGVNDCTFSLYSKEGF